MQITPKPRVLVVDDEAVIADTLCTILNQAGYNASAAYSGIEAIDLAKSVRLDLVISDVAMPVMNGIEAMILVRALLPDCKILLFSGHAATSNMLTGESAQGHNFELIAKPISPKDLLAIIASAGGSARQQ